MVARSAPLQGLLSAPWSQAENGLLPPSSPDTPPASLAGGPGSPPIADLPGGRPAEDPFLSPAQGLLVGDSFPNNSDEPDETSMPAELLQTSGRRVYPYVTTFRNAHLADAMKLAALVGHGATADEVLATAGEENHYGTASLASKDGNYFGIHSNGSDPGRYFPGQIGSRPTSDAPVATYDPRTGFYDSGLRLVARMKGGAGALDLSNPSTFFALAHARGWGVGRKKYLSEVQGVYDVVRRSAAATEKHP